MAAPGGSGPVGPFPASVGDDAEAQDAYDKLRRRVLWTFPSGLFVVGSRSGDRRNAMTMNWVTQVSFDPKLVAVGIEKGALTHELV
ncbi:MAG TPA: flavin reductase, partial [Acidimicrobiales bacterium]